MTTATNVSSSSTRGVFGYLPGHGDFVRVRADSREVRTVSDWAEQGLHQARWEMGGNFDQLYPQLFHRFVFRPDNCERTVMGVLAASVDSHQRPFPFVAFELLPTVEWDRDPVGIACGNEPLFSALEALIRDVGPLQNLGQVHSRVLANEAALHLTGGAALDSESAARDEARYENFLAEVTCNELGIPNQLSGMRVCSHLVDILMRAPDPRQLRFAMEIPLSRPPYARLLELRFFLSLLRKLSRQRQPTWTLFWQQSATSRGSLMISFRQPTIDIFSGLLRRDGRARGIVIPGTQAAQEISGGGSAEPQLLTTETTLAELLSRVNPGESQAEGKTSRDIK